MLLAVSIPYCGVAEMMRSVTDIEFAWFQSHAGGRRCPVPTDIFVPGHGPIPEDPKETRQGLHHFRQMLIDLRDAVQKEIVNLVNKEDKYISTKILWFKNIDKIKEGSELEKFLLDLLDKREKHEDWKYKERDYIFFNAIVVASANDTQNLSSALQTKLNHYEPFLDKHQLIIMGITGVGEVIIFFILIRISRKSKSITKLK